MNRTKPVTNVGAASNKPQTQSRTSNTSITQNSPVAPKSTDKLSKSTASNYLNNNVVDMTRKGSTASGVGRPGSANSQKGIKPVSVLNHTSGNVNNYNATIKRPITPTQNKSSLPPVGQYAALVPPSTVKQSLITTNYIGPPLSLQQPQKQPISNTPILSQLQSPKQLQHGIGSNSASQQKPSPPSNNVTTVTTAQSQQHNNHDATNAKTAHAPVSTTASTTSIKSNGSARPKSTGVNTPQPPKQQVNTGNVSNNNNVGNKPQEGKQAGGGGNNSAVTPKQSTKTFPTPVSHQRYPSNISRSMVSLERSRNFRAFIEKAMNDHKIFTCCGVYPAIRNALKKRGWVEKPGPLAYSRSANTTLSHNRGFEDESDVAWMTRVLKDYPPDFIWVIRRDNIDWKTMTKEQMINRFPKAWFTTKVGLAACLQHMHWFSEAGVSDTFFPRCYRLCLEEERQAFQDDYRLTACMSYLRYFVDTFEGKGHTALADIHSKITPLSVDFASRQLGNYIRMRRHEDIDWLLPPNFMTQHWDAFIHQYYAVVHEKKRLRFDNPEAVHVKYETAKKTLQKVAQYWPQIQLDGVYNMWICKPGARSRGKGIVIMNTLERIMDLMTQNNFRELNWVVQKYIERPMLIYKTKFDIRQWFLITDWTPLTVWFYKESYVRFCTKPFVLEDFHESIHLCNNAIQCRYQNAEQRDSNLPDENMWSSDTFQAYLKTIGRLDAWPLIYSGMKQAIVGVLLASQETVESKKSCYELYGADFMLTEDFRPWLIEINSCPCMAASTSVTARMCAQCLEDTIKVVADRKYNRNADTGMFEMIYRQNAGSVVVQQFSGHDLTIVGKKLTRDIDWPMTMSKSATNANPKKVSQTVSHVIPQSQSINNKENLTFSDLLQKLRVRNQQMFQGALASQQAHTESIVEGTTSANQESTTGALLNKMRSLRAQSQDQDIITGIKKVYPIQDPKQNSKRNSPLPGVGYPTGDKDAIFLSDSSRRPSTPGKGEDPTLSARFTDVNSLAYLMKNTQNTSSTVGDIIRISKETAQEAINKTKRSDDKRQSLDEALLLTRNVPKTLEEVKAMVEATSRHNSEKYGKIYDTNNLIDDEIAQRSCDNALQVHKEIGTIHSKYLNIDNGYDFGNSDKESPNDDDDFEGANPPRDSGTKNSLTLSLSESIFTVKKPKETIVSDNQEENEGSCSLRRIIRRTKSVSFSSHALQRTWVSERDIDLLKNLSEHSIQNIPKKVDSQPYMIYPMAANPSHDDIPCDIKTTSSESIIYACKTSEENNDEVDDDLQMTQNDVTEIIAEITEIVAKQEENSDTSSSDVTNKSNDTENNEVRLQVTKWMEDLPLIDLTCSDSLIQAQLDKARVAQPDSTDGDDDDGKLYKSILAESDSDSDLNDDNNNEVNLDTHFTPSTFKFRHTQPVTVASNEQNRQAPKPKPQTSRLHHRRNTIPSTRRCSRRYPCYRVILEPPNRQRLSKRKTGPTLPLKTINLLLPSNCNYY